MLDDQDVSRQHARLDRADFRVLLSDLGSKNGTFVNGRRLQGPHELRSGDRIRVGGVELAYTADSGGWGGQSYDFGGVAGAVQTGDGIQYAAGNDQYVAHGDQYVAGRDQYHQRFQVQADRGGLAAGRDLQANDYSVRVTNDYDPMDEVFQGRGFGRVLMVVGILIAILGFGLWGWLIFSTISAASNGPNASGSFPSPFTRELLPGVPAAPVGFGAFVIGGILAGVGGGMSKAARKSAIRRQGWSANRD
jgi:hypothetical protein